MNHDNKALTVNLDDHDHVVTVLLRPGVNDVGVVVRAGDGSTTALQPLSATATAVVLRGGAFGLAATFNVNVALLAVDPRGAFAHVPQLDDRTLTALIDAHRAGTTLATGL